MYIVSASNNDLKIGMKFASLLGQKWKWKVKSEKWTVKSDENDMRLRPGLWNGDENKNEIEIDKRNENEGKTFAAYTIPIQIRVYYVLVYESHS